MSVDMMPHVMSGEPAEDARSIVGGSNGQSKVSSHAFTQELAKAGKQVAGRSEDHEKLEAKEGSMEKVRVTRGSEQHKELLYWAQIMSLIEADGSVELPRGESSIPHIAAIERAVDRAGDELTFGMENLKLEPMALGAKQGAGTKAQAGERIALTLEQSAGGMEISQVMTQDGAPEPNPPTVEEFVLPSMVGQRSSELSMGHGAEVSSVAAKTTRSNTVVMDHLIGLDVRRQASDGIHSNAYRQARQGRWLADEVATGSSRGDASGIDATWGNGLLEKVLSLDEFEAKPRLDLANRIAPEADGDDLADRAAPVHRDGSEGVLDTLLSEEDHVEYLVDVLGEAATIIDESATTRSAVSQALASMEQGRSQPNGQSTTFGAKSMLAPVPNAARDAELGHVDRAILDEALHYQRAIARDLNSASSSLIHLASAQETESSKPGIDLGGDELFGHSDLPVANGGTEIGSTQTAQEGTSEPKRRLATALPSNRSTNRVSLQHESSSKSVDDGENTPLIGKNADEPIVVSVDYEDGVSSGRSVRDDEHIHLEKSDTKDMPPEVSGRGATDSFKHVATQINAKGRQTASAIPPRQIVEQVVKQVKLDATGEYGEIRLQLKPEHLGELQVKIATENGVVSAIFVAESHAVKSLIEAGLPQLKDQLMQQGLNIQDVAVHVGGDAPSGQSHAGRHDFGSTSNYPVRSIGAKSMAVASTIGRRNWGNTIDFRA